MKLADASVICLAEIAEHRRLAATYRTDIAQLPTRGATMLRRSKRAAIKSHTKIADALALILARAT